MDEICFVKNNIRFCRILQYKVPCAYANLVGSEEYKNLKGGVLFYNVDDGMLVVVEVFGLPVNDDVCSNHFFGFHIHEGNKCVGNAEDPFKDVGGHYNPDNCKHPSHLGDMPPLFSKDGYCFMIFYDKNLSVENIASRTVIVHSSFDDFVSQPSGNSGKKIGCGEIVVV